MANKITVLICFSLLMGATFVSGLESEKQYKIVTAGEKYRASIFHEWILGKDYRNLWTTPIKVEVLDLKTFADGLKPVMRVGGMMTLGLALKGEDGRDYTFRGIEKDPTKFLPPAFQGTLPDRIIQDQTAAVHPAAPVILPVIADAAGILHTTPILVVMPDDPILGEYREEFKGKLGTIDEYPGALSSQNPGFNGAIEIIDHEQMWKRLMEGPEERIDSKAFLRARLMDIFIGDWDRHRRQWRWVKFPENRSWQVLPEDHDQAFVNYQGLLLSWVRFRFPEVVRFQGIYPPLEGLTWNGRDVDRWILTDLTQEDWMDVAVEFQKNITDEVIDKAVRKMPQEYYRLNGKLLTSQLKNRRNDLVQTAMGYFARFSKRVDIQCTDRSEFITVRRLEGGDVEVKAHLDRQEEDKGLPYYHRVFYPEETEEIRIYLNGGDDRVFTSAYTTKGIPIRIIGGEGNDSVDDASGCGVKFYDSLGTNSMFPGPNSKFDDRPYKKPIVLSTSPWVPPRDWGQRVSPRLWPGFSSDVGLFLGGGVNIEKYSFRKYPFSSQYLVRAGYATGTRNFRFNLEGEFRGLNSRIFPSFSLDASGLEILRFYGYGNESSSDEADSYYKVNQKHVTFIPEIHIAFSRGFELCFGPELKILSTIDQANTKFSSLDPYGSGHFNQVGLQMNFNLQTEKFPDSPTRLFQFFGKGSLYPGLFDVEKSFGSVQGNIVLNIPLIRRLALSFRVGGKKVFGRFPFHEAAFLGGSDTVRGFRRERFAGDASLYGNVELRLKLGRALIIIPGEWGIFGLMDVGRVYLKGENSTKWHRAVGGGLFFSVLDLSTVFSLAVAQSEERTSVYFRLGYSF
ncbi:ShlB/FhaC/HecB family hemolysin secretion/activation protein [Acidobacteriota bacterium]